MLPEPSPPVGDPKAKPCPTGSAMITATLGRPCPAGQSQMLAAQSVPCPPHCWIAPGPASPSSGPAILRLFPGRVATQIKEFKAKGESW